jgi:hypothetical protein
MIDDMVNWAVFVRPESPHFSNLRFTTSSHAELFNIRLGDFLSQLKAFKGQPIPLGLVAPPSNSKPTDLTFLFYLRQVIADPRLGRNMAGLNEVTENFATWLEGEFLAEGVNLADIGVVADIRITRLRYIKICGDIAKHHLARLASNAKHLRSILDSSGHLIAEQDSYLALPGFFEWFHGNIFVFHSVLISKFLNDIRWQVFSYLRPEFERPWHLKDEWIGSLQRYGYLYPADCCEPIAKAMYWELMNRVRGRPWLNPFEIDDTFKCRY